MGAAGGDRARLVNLLAQAPGLNTLFKKLGGISAKRNIPRFASRTFVDWFRARARIPNPGSRIPVLLWPDTFNNHFHPETAIAATEVLEAAGFTVSIPSRPMCCGRPLYDYGFLTHAKALLRDVMTASSPSSAPARRSSCSNRAASPCFATSS
jgi:Fe-S oxidoreductase